MKTYLRTTHHNGQPKQFSAEATAAWHADWNGFVGHMLSETDPMTTNDVMAAISDYCAENHEENNVSRGDVDAALAVLVRFGMAAEIV